MADQRHRELLHEGVSAWNEWRREHPDVAPDLSLSNIRIKRLGGADLRDADLHGSMLTGADLRGADLSRADLSGADLMEADLEGVRLEGADLRKANLMGANLKNADLFGVRLENAILYRADLEGSECAANAIWLQTLMDFADGLLMIESDEDAFDLEDIEDTHIQNSYVSTDTSRLELVLSDPVPAMVGHDILGALNRLYSAAARRDLPGPIIQIGMPDDESEEGGEA